jgi:hypothetical protein
MERHHGRLLKRRLLQVSHPVTIHQQSRNRPIRRVELAADKELQKEVMHLIVELESYEKRGGAPRTAPLKTGSSTKPPGGNLPKGKK